MRTGIALIIGGIVGAALVACTAGAGLNSNGAAPEPTPTETAQVAPVEVATPAPIDRPVYSVETTPTAEPEAPAVEPTTPAPKPTQTVAPNTCEDRALATAEDGSCVSPDFWTAPEVPADWPFTTGDTIVCGHHAKPAIDYREDVGYWAYCEPALAE